jgi:hypothetical protein
MSTKKTVSSKVLNQLEMSENVIKQQMGSVKTDDGTLKFTLTSGCCAGWEDDDGNRIAEGLLIEDCDDAVVVPMVNIAQLIEFMTKVGLIPEMQVVE